MDMSVFSDWFFGQDCTTFKFEANWPVVDIVKKYKKTWPIYTQTIYMNKESTTI